MPVALSFLVRQQFAWSLHERHRLPSLQQRPKLAVCLPSLRRDFTCRKIAELSTKTWWMIIFLFASVYYNILNLTKKMLVSLKKKKRKKKVTKLFRVALSTLLTCFWAGQIQLDKNQPWAGLGCLAVLWPTTAGVGTFFFRCPVHLAWGTITARTCKRGGSQQPEQQKCKLLTEGTVGALRRVPNLTWFVNSITSLSAAAVAAPPPPGNLPFTIQLVQWEQRDFQVSLRQSLRELTFFFFFIRLDLTP